MIDREKVIKGLEHCSKTSCESCPYNAKSSNQICFIVEMLSDALTLLKEQDAVNPKCKERMGGFVAGLCPTCGTALNNVLNVKACGKCGQAVKWCD